MRGAVGSVSVRRCVITGEITGFGRFTLCKETEKNHVYQNDVTVEKYVTTMTFL